MKSAETHPTPPNVVQAINTVAGWLRTIESAECRIAPTGGATFALEAHTTEIEKMASSHLDLWAERDACRSALQNLLAAVNKEVIAEAEARRWEEQHTIDRKSVV